MKRKFLVLFGAVAIVASIAFSFSVNFSGNSLSDISLDSIEALARGEDPGDILYIVCLDDKNSICVYQNHVVLECYYSPHK